MHLLQDLEEISGFRQLLSDENVRSYLEIGSFSGGSIEFLASVFPKGSRIVSVDKPWKNTKASKLRLVLKKLNQMGYDTHLFAGDSADPKIIDPIHKLGPFDAVFIDGDHRLQYVKSDWNNYGVLGRIVGFHDIARDLPDGSYGLCQVASFWQDLKKNYRHVEFISNKTRMGVTVPFGIGVLWNHGS